MTRDFTAELHLAVTQLYKDFDAMTKIVGEVRKEAEAKRITLCHDCGDFKKTGVIGINKLDDIECPGITIRGTDQYFCGNDKCPIRKGTWEEFEGFGCPKGRAK